jgi:hypothetical protein
MIYTQDRLIIASSSVDPPLVLPSVPTLRHGRSLTFVAKPKRKALSLDMARMLEREAKTMARHEKFPVLILSTGRTLLISPNFFPLSADSN